MADSEPLISIVLAAVNPRATLGPWLAALEPQARGRAVELLVAAAGDVDAVRALVADRAATVLGGPDDALVPALWGLGMAAARGRVIAVTISACLPSPGWLDAVVRAHDESPAAGIGGVIDLAPDAGPLDRAVHLVRYTSYLPPQPAREVEEIAGDNGTYKRSAIADLLPAIARDGFWEPEIHRVLRARGEHLRVDPGLLVTFGGSPSAAAFARQRFRHGRVFGRERGRSRPWLARAARACAAPLVPPVMLARALRTVRDRGRLDGRTIAAAPLAACFLACWAAGEAAGWLAGASPGTS
ncbi:MAG TPA: hypothetical protein VL309_01245 [Vicinamibacterales bacterium]|nr:hypothetical protein [Vicinamibacterales bacterium]